MKERLGEAVVRTAGSHKLWRETGGEGRWEKMTNREGSSWTLTRSQSCLLFCNFREGCHDRSEEVG